MMTVFKTSTDSSRTDSSLKASTARTCKGCGYSTA